MEISKDDYIRAYKDFEIAGGRKPRPHLINNVFGLFTRAEFRQLTPEEFNKLIFMYSTENEVTVVLTEMGTTRYLKDVAKKYLDETSNGWTWPDNEEKVKPMIEGLEKGTITSLPPIFLREKALNEPQGGSFYIEDGIHRLLALSNFCLRNGVEPKIDAYFGYFDHPISF